MLTGRLPFSGSSMGEVLMRHLRDQPDLSGIPAPFAAVIAKALAKDPKDRYQDADEMLAAVMESSEIGQHVDSFDASALTQIQRVEEGIDPDQTLTASPPRPPVLDVREWAQPQSPPVPLPAQLHKKLERLSRRLDQKAAALERKFGPGHAHGHRQAERHVAVDGRQRPARFTQTFVLLAVTVMIAVMLSMLCGGRGDDIAERAVALVLLIVGGTVGSLLTHLWLLRRSPARRSVLNRLAYASVSLPFVLPVFGIADDMHDRQLGYLVFAPLLVLIFCDWASRIEQGRTGKVEGWDAFWPGVLGAIAAAVTGAHDMFWVAAGVCATMSLMTQAGAAMWPHPQYGSGPQLPGPGGPIRAQQQPGVIPPRPPTVENRGPLAGHAGEEARELVPPAVPQVMDAARPSFAGGTTHAGTAFLGKLLLLAGIVLAVGHGALRQAAVTGGWDVPRELVPYLAEGVSPGLIILPLIVGGFLLVLARRSDGGLHILRACLGCALMLWGAVMIVNVGGQSLAILLTSKNPSLLSDPSTLAPVIASVAPVAAGLFLLLWPKRGRPIVV